MKRFAVIWVLFAVFFISLRAQTSVVGRVEAELVVPVAAVETDLLNFGRIVVQVGGGSVQVTPKGERVTTGNVIAADDVFSTGKFQLSGVPESLVSMVLPQIPQKLYMSNGDQTLTVDNFTSDVPTSGQIVRRNDGKAEVSIGATLFIGNNLSNPAGFYSGSYEVVFTYN
jgi:hypothetical protein